MAEWPRPGTVPDDGLLPHLIVVERTKARRFPDRWRIIMAKKRRDRFAVWPPDAIRVKREEVGKALKTVFPTVVSNGWMWVVSGNDLVLLRLLDRP
jgi:hypothetical protein